MQYQERLKGPDGEEGPTLEEYWGITTTKYDPAWPEYAKEPEGQFDLVICSHVLGTIPIADLEEWFVRRLFSYATKAVYIVERISLPKKDWTNPTTGCPIGWTGTQWVDLIARCRGKGGPTVYLCVIYPHPSGLIYGMFEF